MATFAVIMSESEDPAVELIRLLCSIKYGDAEDKKEERATEEKRLTGLMAGENFTSIIEQGLLTSVDSVLGAKPEVIYAVYNLSFSLLLHSDMPEQQAEAIIRQLVQSLTKETENSPLKIRLLSTLFNQIDQASHTLRYTVFLNILQYALASEQHQALHGQLGHVDEWMKKWSLDVPQSAQLTLLLADICQKNEQFKQQDKYLYQYFQILETASDDLLASSRPYAAKAALSAIQSPELITSDTLIGLKAIQQLSGDKSNHYSAIFELLRIVATGQVSDYLSFFGEQKELFSEQKLDHDRVLSKMRTLTLCSVGAETPVIPYEQLRRLLSVESNEEVEETVIDAVMSGHIDAKCNQEQEVVTIQRTTARSFNRESWQQLSNKLGQWKDNIKDVLDFLAQVRERK